MKTKEGALPQVVNQATQSILQEDHEKQIIQEEGSSDASKKETTLISNRSSGATCSDQDVHVWFPPVRAEFIESEKYSALYVPLWSPDVGNRLNSPNENYQQDYGHPSSTSSCLPPRSSPGLRLKHKKKEYEMKDLAVSTEDLDHSFESPSSEGEDRVFRHSVLGNN